MSTATRLTRTEKATMSTPDMTRILTVETPVGVFTRKTDAPYTHVTVRVPASGADAFVKANQGAKRGVVARYVRDRGYVLVWHKSEAAARREAAKGRETNWLTTVVIGVFPVNGSTR